MGGVRIAPRNAVERQLFFELREICGSGTWEMHNGGTGQPGAVLEDLLGIETNNVDLPDFQRWEVKFHGGTAPITLFHKEGQPKGAVGKMVKEFGWLDANGRRSFRHTIWGESNRGFKVVDRDDRINVTHAEASLVSWSHDMLVVTASSKLRNTVLVAGRVSRRQGKRFVDFKDAYLLADFLPSAFVSGLIEGWIAVDFDAREQSPGSNGFRNHGTKFRVKHQDMRRIFGRVEKLI